MPQPKSLNDLLDIIPESRKVNAIKHNLKDSIFIALLSVICNADNYVGIQLFGEIHEDILKQFLELPSHDAFDDVFSAIAPIQLLECLPQWLHALHTELKEAGLVAIDGKIICRSKKINQEKATHVITAFSSELQLVLG